MGTRPSLAGLAFVLFIALDVAGALIFGTAVKPATYFTDTSWLHQHFLLGESTLDLVGLALLRALLMPLLLLLARGAAARKVATSPAEDSPPLLEPLQLNAAARPLSDGAEGGAKPKKRRLPKVTPLRCSLALAAISIIYSGAKALARMLESGLGTGGGMLPPVSEGGTTPSELWFWLALSAGPCAAWIEYMLFESLLPKAAGAADGEGGKAAKSGTDKAKEKEDPAEAARKAYLERTNPKMVRSIRSIFRMTRPDWHLMAFAYASLTVAAAGDTSIPFLYGQLIDAIAISRDPDKFRSYMLMLVGCAIGTGIFTGFRGSTFIVIGGRFSVRLRQRLFASLMRQELDFFSAVRTGDITSRLSADCQKVGDQVQLNVNVFLRSVIQVLFTLGFMVVISWRLALTCFVAVPCIVWASKIFGDYMRTLSTETQDALAKANSAAEEVISSISTTRAFAAEAAEEDNYGKGMAEYLDCCVRTAKVYYVYSSTTFTFLPYCAYCLVLYYGAQLTQSPPGCGDGDGLAPCDIAASGLVSFVFYMQSLFSAFTSIGNIYTALAQAVGAADKVLKWIEREPQLQPHPQPLAPASCRGDLKLVRVSFRYALRPEKLVLDGLSLHVRPGEVVALCGPSGGGKSSCIALLERFYAPETGEVLLDDVPIGRLESGWFHRQVALVGQEPVLFARSIEDNICYGLDEEDRRPTTDEVHAAAILANAHDFVTGFELGYSTAVGERGAQLSGGQKQRIAIARALVRHPSVLLLDEATSALDAESEGVVQAAIDSMIAQGGMTVLVIAHRLSTIRNADRICVIKGGRVAEEGRHEELMAKPAGEYAKLVAKQMQMHSSSGSDLASAVSNLAAAAASAQ